MDKRLEKAKYMTGVAKASEQMASNERDMARIDGATQAMQEASQKVEKYTERIAMSEKTETHTKSCWDWHKSVLRQLRTICLALQRLPKLCSRLVHKMHHSRSAN